MSSMNVERSLASADRTGYATPQSGEGNRGMSSGVRLRLRCRVTTALCCSLASVLAAASPAWAADECGPVPSGGGAVECPTGDYPDGISYDAGVEDLAVVVDPGSTLEG